MADLAKIKRNVAKMVDMGAPEQEVDAYISSEGVTVDDVRNFKPQSGLIAQPANTAPTTGGMSVRDGILTLSDGRQMDRGAAVEMQQQLKIKAGVDPGLALPSSATGFNDIPNNDRPDGYVFGTSRSASLNPLPAVSLYGNELAGSIPAAGPFLKNVGERFDAAVDNAIYRPMTNSPGVTTPQDVAKQNAQTAENNPQIRDAGRTSGPLVFYALLSRIPGASRALGLEGNVVERGLTGFGSQLAITTADNMARGQNPVDAFVDAIFPAVVGASTSMILGSPKASPEAKQVAKALEREGITDAAMLRARLTDMGDRGMIADLGPNLTRQASTIASLPGEGQAIVRRNLNDRAGTANQTINNTLDQTIGPAPIPSVEQGAIRAGQTALDPQYRGVLQNARPVNVAPIVQNIEGNIQMFRGEAQQYLQRLRPMFNDFGTNNLTASAEVLLEVRKAIDGMLEGDITNQTRGALSGVRRRVDSELAARVPGLKQVDAQFADLAQQSEALTRGGQVLRSGPEAPVPMELAGEMALGSPGVQRRLSQGARADIERIVGNNANDVQALNRLLKGEGDWNRQKLSILFGAARADRILRVLDQELRFARTNATVQQGPETAARIAGKEELGEVNMSVPRDATITGMSLNVLSRGLTKLVNLGRGAVNARIATILTTPGLQRANPRLFQQLQAAMQAPNQLNALKLLPPAITQQLLTYSGPAP